MVKTAEIKNVCVNKSLSDKTIPSAKATVSLRKGILCTSFSNIQFEGYKPSNEKS